MRPPACLLLRLAGPMQSWGTQSRFSVRDTGLEPSKSGVVGLVCAALGRPRSAAIADLAALSMGVRVDCEGRLAVDFHTAMDVLKASGKETKDTEPSRRYYLADASFLVALQGDEELLQKLHAALYRPVWPLYLGRKAFVPGQPVWLADGLQAGHEAAAALRTHPWLGSNPARRPGRLRLVVDDPGGPEVRPDVPISFDSANRRFGLRRVRTEWMAMEEPPCTSPV